MEVTKKGIVEIQTPDQMDRNEQAQLDEQAASQEIIQNQLEAFTQRCFQAAKDHKDRYITPKLMQAARQYDGQYEPAVMAAIQQMGGTQVFMNITQSKCNALFSWIRDIVNPAGDRSFGLTASPIPDLPPQIEAEVIEEIVQQFNVDALADGIITPEEIATAASKAYDHRIQAMAKEAKVRAKRHEDKIADQFTEGSFFTAMEDMIRDLCQFKTGWVKGPIVRRKERLEYDKEDNGNLVPRVEKVDIPTYNSPSPFDMYPAPAAKSIETAPYMCETIEISSAELSGLRGVEGYQSDRIEMILKTMPGGYRLTKVEQPVLEQRESRESAVNVVENTATYDAVEFWGRVPRHMLSDFGIAQEEGGNPYDYIAITNISIAGHIIRAITNPNPKGDYPYHGTSVQKVNRSIWGFCIPEMLEEIQAAYASTHRALINNMAIAAGPQVSINIDALAPGEDPRDIHPMKVWRYSGNNDQVSGRKPVDFFHPEIRANEIIGVAKHYEDMADDRTAIPRYAYGNADVGGAGNTAAGLSMLMSNAAKGVRVVAGNVDTDILMSCMQQQYTWNLIYLGEDWNDIKGDAFPVPRGVLAILVKEQLQLRRQEFLNLTNNPTDLQILGVKGRVRLLRAIADGLDIPEEELLPSEDELERQAQQSITNQMPQDVPGGQDMPYPEGMQAMEVRQ